MSYLLEAMSYGGYLLTDIETEEDVYFQTDYDFPGLAQTLGWDMRSANCDHSSTDGTVKCDQCGKTAGEFISEAEEWLNSHDGEEFDNDSADDYFGSE